jgi:hypothetical protein
MGDLGEWARVAQAEGVAIAQIAREAELTTQGVRELLAGRVVCEGHHRRLNATAANRNQEK